MEFWSIEQPTQTLTYTLTISAPILPEDWLVPLEHDPLSPKEEKEQLETLGQITITVENDTTTKSPWDVILNYTTPKVANAAASSFETWSKRAQVKRARKSNGKAQSRAGGAGAKAGGDPVVVGGSGLLPQREGEGGAMSELYRILQPVANGLTSGKPLNQVTATCIASSSSSRLPSQTATPPSAESALLAKTAKSASEVTNAISQSPFPTTGSNTSWNGSISPTGSEIATSTVSNTINRSTPQAINVSMNRLVQESQVLTTTQSHQPVSSTPQLVSSIPQIMDSTTMKESIPQQSISSLPQIIPSTARECSMPHRPISSTLQITAMCNTTREDSLPLTVTNGSMGLPLTTVSALDSGPIAAAPHINTAGENCSESPLSIPGVATSEANTSESISTAPHTSTTTASTNQANARLNQANQGSLAACNTALIPGAPLISTNAGSSGIPSKLLASQALYTSALNEKVPKVSHIPPVHVSMAKSNGALSESFLEEVTNPAVFSSFISPQIHVVKGDAVTATLMFANDGSATPSSGSYEVDIVKIQNNQLSVTKETDSVATEKMDVEAAVTSGEQKEKSPAEDELSTKNVSEISVLSKESDLAKEVRTVSEGEGKMGGANATLLITKEVTTCSNSNEEPKGGHEIENSSKRTESECEPEGQKTPPTIGSKTTPTPTSPKPTTPTSMVSLTNSNPTFSPGPKATSPPTSGPRSPPTSPVIAVFQNMTYVPYISNNHLYLYPVSPHSLIGHTPSQQSPSHMQFVTAPPGLNMPQSPQHQRNEFPLNQKSVNKVKTPRRRRKQPKSSSTTPQQPHSLVTAPASQAPPESPVTHQRSSEDAVAKSLCLQRKGEGLPINPFSLTYTVTSSAGHSWSTNSLEGERTLMVR